MPPRPKSESTLLERALNNPSESRLQIQRNLGYGASGASFLLALTFIQMKPTSDIRLEWGLFYAVIAMGAWLSVGGMYEGAVMAGRSSHRFIVSERAQNWIGSATLVAGLAMLGSFGLLLHWVSELVAWSLAAAAALCVLFSIGFSNAFERWLATKAADRPSDPPP